MKREKLAAARPRFDQEHCEGCLTLVSRGSLVNTKVDRHDGLDAWKALCRRCIRLRSEPAA